MQAQVIGLNDPVLAGAGGPGRKPIPLGADRYEMTDLLRLVVDHDASDLHLAVGRPPMLRIDGVLCDVEGQPLAGQETRDLNGLSFVRSVPWVQSAADRRNLQPELAEYRPSEYVLCGDAACRT